MRWPFIAAIVLGVGACTPASLEVLEPAPLADGGRQTDATIEGGKDGGPPSDASSPDAPVDAVGDAVLPGNEGGPCSGLEQDAACSASAQCCSGWCAASGASKACEPTVGCLGEPTTCTFAGQCCSLACVPGSGDTKARQCGDGPPCSIAGSPCTAAADCCSAVCMAGHCGMSPPRCRPAGETCMGNGDCCSTLCSAGRCALLSGCRVQGEVCGSSSDCCSGACLLGPDSIGHCAALAMCTENDRQMCTRQVGEILRRQQRLLLASVHAGRRRRQALRAAERLPRRVRAVPREHGVLLGRVQRAGHGAGHLPAHVRHVRERRRDVRRQPRLLCGFDVRAPGRPVGCPPVRGTRRRWRVSIGWTVLRHARGVLRRSLRPVDGGGAGVQLGVLPRQPGLHVRRRLLRERLHVPVDRGILACARSVP